MLLHMQKGMLYGEYKVVLGIKLVHAHAAVMVVMKATATDLVLI